MRLRDIVNELRNCGRSSAAGYNHVRIGHNCRLDEIQAAILRVKLLRLEAWTAARDASPRSTTRAWPGLPLQLPPLGSETSKPVFHLYTVRSDRRDALAEDLAATASARASTTRPRCISSPPTRTLGVKAGTLPVTEAASREALSLPMYPELSSSDAGRVIETVRRFFK